MNYKLFSNPGKKIKTISLILFWVLTVSSIICAVSFGWVERHGYYSTSKVFVPEVFFSFLLVGPIASYLSSLLLYGYGELIENSKPCSPETITNNYQTSIANTENVIGDTK
ncbi:MAG: hypothetical protein IJI66_09790 [Erysipelotrichaceae bacterium]|nr:hypothetical protein [Erysipelotrichaceae bacterium]